MAITPKTEQEQGISVRWPAQAPRIGFEFCDPGCKDHIHDNFLRKGNFYEEDLLRFLASLKLGEGVILDVGAYIGNHSIFFAGIMGRSVVSIEANPSSYELLSKNIGNNCLSGLILPLCLAATDLSGVSFGRGGSLDFNQGATRFVRAGDQVNVCPIEDPLIEGIALDDLELDQVALIKIDVEGMELDVLKGLIKTIGCSKPVLAIECMTAVEFSQVAAFCRAIGYLPIARKAATPVLIFAHKSSYENVCHGCPPPAWSSLVP